MASLEHLFAIATQRDLPGVYEQVFDVFAPETPSARRRVKPMEPDDMSRKCALATVEGEPRHHLTRASI
jgi:hypothetical protein